MDLTLVFAQGGHQNAHAQAVAAGLDRLGVRYARARVSEVDSPRYVACWGWRTGKALAEKGCRVLVLERGYMGDRFAWTSLGWDGLNGRARFAPAQDDGARFAAHFEHLLRPPDERPGDYVLLIGQVPHDASLQGRDMRPWYAKIAQEAREYYGLPVFFRRHPKAPPYNYDFRTPDLRGRLSDALDRARVVITYNSNTAVESVLAGKRTLAFDEGSMAWDVTGHALGEVYAGDPTGWARRLAWRQWQLGEIADGSALRAALDVAY